MLERFRKSTLFTNLVFRAIENYTTRTQYQHVYNHFHQKKLMQMYEKIIFALNFWYVVYVK